MRRYRADRVHNPKLLEARNYLKFLRRGTDQYEYYISFIMLDVSKGHYTLEKIGTSEEEFEVFRTKGREVTAKKKSGVFIRNQAILT